MAAKILRRCDEFLFERLAKHGVMIRVVVCWHDTYNAGQWGTTVSGYRDVFRRPLETAKVKRMVELAGVNWELFQDEVMEELARQPQ